MRMITCDAGAQQGGRTPSHHRTTYHQCCTKISQPQARVPKQHPPLPDFSTPRAVWVNGHMAQQVCGLLRLPHNITCRVGQNHICTVCKRYFWQGNHQIYGHIRCKYTFLANPNYMPSSHRVPATMLLHRADMHARTHANVHAVIEA